MLFLSSIFRFFSMNMFLFKTKTKCDEKSKNSGKRKIELNAFLYLKKRTARNFVQFKKPSAKQN